MILHLCAILISIPFRISGIFELIVGTQIDIIHSVTRNSLYDVSTLYTKALFIRLISRRSITFLTLFLCVIVTNVS